MKDVLLLIRNAPRETARICALAVLPALFALSLSGDTIELKTGERIEGTFKQATSAGAVIEVGGQSITIPLEKVQAIYFGVAPAREATTQAPPQEVAPTRKAPSQEAMDALKAIRSVTGSGIAYRDYSQKVLEAKVQVDRYISSSANDSVDLRNAIERAMRQYELASQAWSGAIAHTENELTAIGKILEANSEISKCSAIWSMIGQVDQSLDKNRPNWPEERASKIGVRVGVRPALLWTCASGQLARAERLLSPHPEIKTQAEKVLSPFPEIKVEDPANTRDIPAGCDAVWSAIVPAVANRGFMPESSDKAGGFMKLRYMEGATGWLGSNNKVKELTEHRVGLLETYDRFEISSGSLSLTAHGNGCRVMLQFEYRGFKKGLTGDGWFALPSNGQLESTILSDLQAALTRK